MVPFGDRAILDNPAYRGIRVWGKQEKYEVLVNPDDVAAGYETRMRWRDEADWIAPGRTHEALIRDEPAQAVRLRMGAAGPGLVAAESQQCCCTRGLLFCAACGRMRALPAQGSEQHASSTVVSSVSRVRYPRPE
ncbi:hypothetical protein MTIM_53420 [Mycobacterium timonense]|uniref:Recombinase domain-containing protein n=1 Tax=Mycobacterium timonense TaxID=701043 RepID=A0A7I9ZEX2_9MYCO|nr:hypothetical protein MTIM_53420 [Mycobacterium timonense]